MFPACPTPEHPIDVVVDTSEQTLGNDVSMVVCPASQERVEPTDQIGCLVAATTLNTLARLLQHAADALPCGFDQQLLSVFAHILAQEIKSLGDGRDDGLFLGELESALSQERDNGRFDWA